jgi:hypothetical protein
MWARSAARWRFALGMFVYLHGQQEQQMRTIPVAVIVRPPEDPKRELMTAIPPSIHVTLRGSMRRDRSLDSRTAAADRNRPARRPAEEITFEPKMFSLPPSKWKSRSSIRRASTLDWQDVVTRQIPCKPRSRGSRPKASWSRASSQVEPKEITSRGPASLVEVLQFARLAPFDVNGLTEGVYRRRIAIDEPPARVNYIGPPNATVTVTIARRLSEARFAKAPGRGHRRCQRRDHAARRRTSPCSARPRSCVRCAPSRVVPRADVSNVQDVDLKNHGSASVK